MMRGPALRATAGPLCAVFLASACYRYVPAPSTDLVPGDVYRGYLSPDGSSEVARTMGPDMARFDGSVVSATDTGLLVAMRSSVRRTDPRRMVWSGEQLFVPRSAVLSFERRELDGRKTLGAFLLTAAGIAVTGAIWLSIKGKVGGNPGDGGGGTIPF